MASSVYSGDFPGILVWEAATGKEVTRINLKEAIIAALGYTPRGFITAPTAFSLDGKYIVSISPDQDTYVWGVVFVWEVASGKVVARLRLSQEDDLNSVAFSPDGKYLVSGSDDHFVRLWLWRPEDLIAEACSRVTRNLTRSEWQQYIGDAQPYQAVCPNLPIEPEPTATPTP